MGRNKTNYLCHIGGLCEAVFRAFLVLAATSLTPGISYKCNVVVYFGKKTAECQSLGLDGLPTDMGYDLKVLHFKDNKITHLGIDYFKSYTAIQELFLERNVITTIAPEAFRGLGNLQVLDLSGNDLSTVPLSSFRYLTSLRELILKGNPIKYITENAFGNLPRIEVLNFENCWLERVDPKAFHGLTYVKEINIVNNELKTLGAYMEFSLPPNLSIFRLYRNPWRCDCHLRWLREWIEKTKVNWDFSQNTPACATPEIMRGLNWKHLKPDQFACPSQILANGTTSLELEVGQNVTIECLVTGDPRPTIRWYKGGNHISVTSNMEKFMQVNTGLDPIRNTLTIWDVSLDDAGDYKCVAENSAGRSEVTNKLWIWDKELDMSRSQGTSGISQESILGIAVGSALFLLILVVCVVYGLRRRDRRKHAYRVRDYKKPNKNKKDKSYIKENSEKSASATTELLSEKEKEKEKGKVENAVCENATANNVKENSEDFKMKIFAYRSGGPKDNQTELDLGHSTPERDDRETEPLCKGDSLKPTCNNLREVTPDLLKNDNNTSKPLHTKKPNHVTIKEENPYVKGEYRPNGGIDRQKDLQFNKDYGTDYKDYHKDYDRDYSSREDRGRHRDNRDHRGSPKREKRDPNETRHPNSPRGSLEDIIAQTSSSSRDSIASTQRGSSRGSPCRSPNPDYLEETSDPSHYGTSSLSKNPEHRRERISDGVKFATLPSKSSGAKSMPASSYMKSGTLRATPRSGNAGRGTMSSTLPERGQRPRSAHGWGSPQTSPQGSPASIQSSRPPGSAPLPIIKLPDGQLVGKKDYRTLVVPPPPLPPANRSPFAIKSPSGPAALVNPGEGLPAPRKPPRTFSSMYENPYGTVSRQASKASSQGSRQSSHDSEGEGIHRVGHQDEFGTCV